MGMVVDHVKEEGRQAQAVWGGGTKSQKEKRNDAVLVERR
jgi:hypothetical protein